MKLKHDLVSKLLPVLAVKNVLLLIIIVIITIIIIIIIIIIIVIIIKYFRRVSQGKPNSTGSHYLDATLIYSESRRNFHQVCVPRFSV